jgi:hypothetical protein
MKSLGSLLVVLFLSFSLNAQEFKFQEEVIDYGKIDKGSLMEQKYLSLKTLETNPLS